MEKNMVLVFITIISVMDILTVMMEVMKKIVQNTVKLNLTQWPDTHMDLLLTLMKLFSAMATSLVKKIHVMINVSGEDTSKIQGSRDAFASKNHHLAPPTCM